MGGSPNFLLAFSSPPAFSPHSSFHYLLLLLPFILSFLPPKSALFTRLPYFFPLPLSFLRTTPHSYTTSQFNHCTSESFEFLSSHLFVLLLENPRLAFILLALLKKSNKIKLYLARIFFFFHTARQIDNRLWKEEGKTDRMNPAEVFQATNSTGDSSFFEKDSNSSILKVTIKKNTAPTRKDGMNPDVFRATSTGDLSFFEKASNSDLHERTPEKNTVLHVALQFKKFDAAKKILDLSPSLALRTNTKGNTPLHVAAMVGASSLVKILIEKAKKERDVEANDQQLLSMVNLDGDTALHIAVRYGNFDVVKELINETDTAGLAKKENNARESALFLAVDRQDYVMASHILEKAQDCSYAGRHGMNVLHALVIHTSSCKCCSICSLKILHFSFRMWSSEGINIPRVLANQFCQG